MMEIILPAILFLSISAVIYLLFSSGKNLKVDKLLQSASHIDAILEKRMWKEDGYSRLLKHINAKLSQSRVKIFGSKMSLVLFLLLSLVCSIGVFFIAADILKNLFAAFLLGAFSFFFPYEAISLDVRLSQRRLRRHLPNFFLILNSLSEAAGDIVEVLETALPRMKQPLRSNFKKFVRDYKAQKPLDDCIDTLKNCFHNEVLKRFIEDIRSNIENGGDFTSSLENYINDAYDNERNYTERLTENTGNLTSLAMVVGMFLMVLDLLSKNQPEFISILLYNPTGRSAVNIIILLFVCSAAMMRYSISYKDD